MIASKKLFDVYTVILILFCFIEVLFYEDNEAQFLFSVLEYLLCTFLLLTNTNKGIIYFVSFTLLSLGVGNFYNDDLPNNFWGLRIGNFSVNIIYSIFITIYVLLVNKKNTIVKFNFFYKFLLIFFLYGIVRGIIAVAINENFLDNFFKDLMTYFPLFIYIYLLKQLKSTDYEKIFISTVLASIFLLFFAFIFDRKFKYGNNYFLVQNTVCNVILISIFLLRKKINIFYYVMICLVFLFFIINGLYFLSGKIIITLLLFLFINLLKNKNFRIIFLPVLILLFFQFNFVLDFLIDFFHGNVISFKLEQIKSLINISSIAIVSKSHTSIGNLLSEIMTTTSYFLDNTLLFFVGKGFGGGIPDVLGLLKVWIDLAGYNEIDAARNDYFKMHLPITEMFVKGGVFMVILYLFVLYSVSKYKNSYTILFIFMFFLFFYISKENLLYTILLFNIMIVKNEDKLI
jgi:hypothetical protein